VDASRQLVVLLADPAGEAIAELREEVLPRLDRLGPLRALQETVERPTDAPVGASRDIHSRRKKLTPGSDPSYLSVNPGSVTWNMWREITPLGSVSEE